MKTKLSESKKKEPIIGIIKPDTKFQRILGDIGSPQTWDLPVIYEVMKGISPEKVVHNNDDFELLSNVIETAKILEKQGVHAITTTCGFLSNIKKKLATVLIYLFLPLVYCKYL